MKNFIVTLIMTSNLVVGPFTSHNLHFSSYRNEEGVFLLGSSNLVKEGCGDYLNENNIVDKLTNNKDSNFVGNNGTFTDARDGKIYKWVRIKEQIWMAENLAYKTDSGCWVYRNNPKYLKDYGYLYNWKTAQKVCPQGWHLPSKDEFKTLLASLGGEGYAAYDSFTKGSDYGFSAKWEGSYFADYYLDDIPGRHRHPYFGGKKYGCFYWSSSSALSARKDTLREFLIIHPGEHGAGMNSNFGGENGYSVRCIKN